MADTSMADFIDAEQAAERLRDGYADYFTRFDALVTHVLPIPARKHGVERFTIVGTSREGVPINVQVIGAWHAEPTILQAATLLGSVSPVRGLFPDLRQRLGDARAAGRYSSRHGAGTLDPGPHDGTGPARRRSTLDRPPPTPANRERQA